MNWADTIGRLASFASELLTRLWPSRSAPPPPPPVESADPRDVAIAVSSYDRAKASSEAAKPKP